MGSTPPLRVELARKSDCPALADIYCHTILPTQPPDPSKTVDQVRLNWVDNLQGLVECSAGLYPHDALVKASRPSGQQAIRDTTIGFALWWLKRKKGRGADKDDLVGIQRESTLRSSYEPPIEAG